jgi:hypothetical protein
VKIAALVAFLPMLSSVALPGASAATTGTAGTAAAAMTAAAPVTQTITATEDTYRTPWLPPGRSPVDGQVLMAGDEQLDGRVSYLKFPVPVLPANAADVSATLNLFEVGSAVSGGITVYRIVDPWDQAGLTDASAPGLAGPLGYGDVAGTGGIATSVQLPPAKVPWGGTASVGVTAGSGGALALAFASTRQADQSLWPTLTISYDFSTAPTCSVSSLLVPSCGAWFGSTTNQFGAETSPAAAVARQESELGRRLDIVHVYHSGNDDWPTPTEVALATDPATPRLLMVNWKPENGTSWADITAGLDDPWIDTVAGRILSRLGGTRFFLTLHHEPEQEVLGAGSGFSEADYVAMFRHVVQRLRADGVDPVVVWDVMGYAAWGDLGYYDALYPGDDIVDWIAYDPYSHAGAPLTAFANRPGRTFPGFYTWATTNHPSKPLMLGEFGVESSVLTDRVAVLSLLAAQAQTMPAIKAYVYFDHAVDSTTGGSNWAYDTDPTVLAAARSAFTDPFFLHP